jgi:hypothetical protein
MPRQSLGLPADSIVIVSAGRSSKFMNVEFWTAIFSVLHSCENAYFVVIGLSSAPNFLPEILPPDLEHRVKLLGWLDGYQSFLKIADIFVDTFPSGGGVVVLEAMACNIPVITFREDYSSHYTQMNWNPAAEMIPVEELILPRYNFAVLKIKLTELIVNGDLRIELGSLCGQEARVHRGNPSRSVKKCEIFLKKFLESKLAVSETLVPVPKFCSNVFLETVDFCFSRKSAENSLIMQREILRLQQELLISRRSYASLFNSRSVRIIRWTKNALSKIGLKKYV